MVESQKGAAPNSDSKGKSSLLDEEFGKEFLSSWKTMSVTEDDGMDFSCEPAPKGMKKNFNFDKLDMDFALDGDFGKLSSFKVDMSDLDFSSPKSTDRPDKKSIDGKREAKKDHFNFNFDFKELDNFDLDSSLMKGKQKSEKCTDDKEFDSSVRHEKDQVFRSNLATEADAFKEDDAKKASVMASKFEGLTDGDFDSITGGAPTNSKFENVHASGGATASQDENISNRREESNQPSKLSSKSYDQQPIQDSSGQSVSFDDPRQETAADLQAGICSSETERDANQGLQSAKCETGKSLGNQSQVSMKNISGDESAPGNAGLQSTRNEFQKMLEIQNHIPMRNISGNKSALGNADIVDASTTSLSPNMQNTKARKENNDSVSHVLLAPVQSEPKADKVMQMKEQGNGCTHLTFLSRTQENVSQSHLALTSMKIHSLGEKRKESAHLSPTDQRSDAQGRNPKVGTSSSHDATLTKDVPVIKESEKNDKDHSISGPSSKVHDASLPEKAAKSKPLNINPKDLVPSMNYKSISVERMGLSPLKVGNKTSDATSLKFSRIVTSKNDLSVSKLQKEFKSLRNSEGSMEMHLDLASMMNQSSGSEKQKLPTPSLKRKTFEEPSANPVMLYPLKRITETPNHSRKAREVSQQVDESLVHNRENLVDCCNNDVLFDHPTCKLDTSQQVPIVMENDENVEKAEAYIKELEDKERLHGWLMLFLQIRNMLKKKHEEAKEVLVRALVNNNNLLMLNHPIYEEKISTVMRFAASMRSKELQS
ncbi:uncharacterized protein At4g18490 isoform X2 [Macadamia integrifolia]|uniref:uncharacterized protein At4g18490 isoform X2 n=1 Tax=Macadamia integrifolia TaxID=60698 RepID=UPI001C4F3BD3|nr:uncharacterized protein At4g18490 isoform X2 [Macadamia integrifolia]XP_042490380.1 uncharacterized protein At4g18490 isoform X2 [Macadamia integrifolia]